MSAGAKNKYTHTLKLPETDFPMRADAAVREPLIQDLLTDEVPRTPLAVTRKRLTCGRSQCTHPHAPASNAAVQVYQWQHKALEADGKSFVLHDGPPFANGRVHMGHLMNKVIQTFTRTQTRTYTHARTHMYTHVHTCVHTHIYVFIHTQVLKDIFNRYHLLQGHRISYHPGWDTHGLPIELKATEALRASGACVCVCVCVCGTVGLWDCGTVGPWPARRAGAS